jgi:hypothetical protein
VVSVDLNGEGVAQGHEGGHPPRSGSSAGRLVRSGGRSVRAHVGRLWQRKADRARLDRAQKQNNRGVRCGQRHAEAGENGARHLGSCTGATEMGVGRAVSGAVREQGSRQCAWSDRGRKELGWARENSADLDLKQISKLNMI